MQQSDFQHFHAVMLGMSKIYERELDQPLLDAYWLALRDWPLQEFERAAAQLMRTSRFMPRPADFTVLRRAERPTAGEAWALVLEHLRTGAYRWDSGPPTWNDAMPKLDRSIERSVRALGGYRALAMMPIDQLPWQERRFAQHYAEMTEVEETRAALGFGGDDPMLPPPGNSPRGLAKL